MKRFDKCIDCEKPINSNTNRCSYCIDIKLFGSVENAIRIAKENFKKIGL